jgi:outer membrane protein assembly factor BamB/TolA-binding protein
MRTSCIRLLTAGILLASIAGLTLLGGSLVRGQGKLAAPPLVKDAKADKKDERSPEDENLPFSFPYERDAKNQLKAARDYLGFKVVPWNIVCPLLQNILESRSDSFFDVTYSAGSEKRINRISVKTEANRIIAAFSPEGLQFYQQAYGQTASALLNEAIKANYDIPMLADLSQKYFHTRAGAEATVLLGTLYLERGNYLEAAYTFERMLGRPASEEFLTGRTLLKACMAFKRSGDARHAELLKTALEQLQRATSRDGLALGRKTYTFEQLRSELDRRLELLRPSSTVGEWAMRGGNPSRSGTADGGTPFLSPTFRSSMFPVSNVSDEARASDQEGNAWITTEIDKQFARDAKLKSVPLPAFFPVTTADMVVYRTYNGIYAASTRDHVVQGRVIRAGEILWSSKTQMGLHQLVSASEGPTDINMRQIVTSWWNSYVNSAAASVLYENPLIGALAQDGQNVYFVDDIAIPPSPVMTNADFMMNNQMPQQVFSGSLGAGIRAGRLVAVNLKSGMEVWELGRQPYTREPGVAPPPPLNEDDADKTTDAFRLCLDAVFLGPPLPLNGKLFVLIEQAGVIRLLCLDPKALVAVPGRTRMPTLLWSQKLGRPNASLLQDSTRRYQGTTLAASEGVIVCPTNSGAVVAVDIMSHSLLWAHAYRKLESSDRVTSQPMFPGAVPNGRFQQPSIQQPYDRWRAGGPIISSGRVILTAHDSNKLECLDLRTGKVLWSTSRESQDLYVGGIVNDTVVVVGKSQVRGYSLFGEDADHKPKLAFDLNPVPTPTGHGVGARGIYYLPVRPDNAGVGANPAAEIWAINVETGQVVAKTAARKRNDNTELTRYGLGNLVFQDGQVFAQSAWELACYPQLEQKKAEMDRLLAANPKDPIGLLNRGELLLDDGKLKEAIADFQEAEKNNLPEDKRPFLREKKYVAYTELLRNDFAAGERYLAEYSRLCEIPADASEGPEEKVRREEEISRRQRWREYLLAKGREEQGRLGEAFDHYIALANMGELQNLLEMPDEPNVRMRPDVWARGRIEGMIRRTKDGPARQSLEDRVQKEWESVKAGNDLRRLREFVAVFGPYFATGAEAQFLLATKLLETNNDADSREAQTYLSQLRATGESPEIRARATLTLARLMVSHQMMEDAVGLYLQLGKEYPKVVVQDGKTGAEFMTDLLTDKRLLPYLEPSRYPMPTRLKAEQRDAVNNAAFGVQIEVEPNGDLFPMYRRYRFVMDQFSSQNGSWTLRGFDRATGAERCKFPGLLPPQMFNPMPGSIPFANYIQANGQLLLVQLGSWVYCLDLSEKKERWQKNLLGDAPAGVNPNPPIQGQDGEDVVVRYEDGYIITLGRAAVLQAGYAALLTRDGLEVVEPLTRKVLWTRKGIAPRTQIYGDSRYLLLVQMDPYKKPVATQLLRAVDGMPVEGSPDIGRTLQAIKFYRIYGSMVLLMEGGGDQPRSLRMLDLITGKDLWKREYDAKAIPIKSLSSDWCGFIKPSGEAEVLEVKSGKILATLQIDKKNLAADLQPCVSAQLFADADRFYLTLDRGGASASSGAMRQQMNNNSMRAVSVNGPIYAFDRTSGKRLWYYGDGLGLFENQMMVLEQFADLPVIIVSGLVTNQQTKQAAQSVIIVEKARGRLLMDKQVQYTGQFFQSLKVNMDSGTIEINRSNLQVMISADDVQKADAP